MKKYMFLLIVTSIYSLSTFSQVMITPEKLAGDWKVTGGEGEHFDKEAIGSVFHFQPSGKFIANLTAADNAPATQKFGTWKVLGNDLLITFSETGKKEVRPVPLPVTKFENGFMYVLDEKSEMTIIFERIKN